MKPTTIQALRAIYVALGGTATDIPDNMEIPAALLLMAPLIASTIELPAATTDGQVLTVSGGKWVSAAIPSQLPAATTNGQVLTVSEGNWVSSAIPSQLPAVSAPGDVGKVLKVNDEGKWAPGTDEIQA